MTLQLKSYFSFLLFVLTPVLVMSQESFAEKCEGLWTGQLMIYAQGELKDSVDITLDVIPVKPGTWAWKTSYHSKKHPMVKDYLMISADRSQKVFVMDEGKGVELINYQFGEKLYCVFETGEVLLTSSYELRKEKMVFEVTSGKFTGDIRGGVRNFPVSHVQRAVLVRDANL